MSYLAVCAIFRNEAAYLLEWLSYHYTLGVRRFVLYDNFSTDQSVAVIGRWAHHDIVTVIDWPHQGGQVAAYKDMVLRFQDAAEWCAFIDCDEFLCPQSNLSVTDVLRRLGSDVNGLYVHWWMFGSAGHVTRQLGLVTETFCWRAPDDFGAHFVGKSIMRLKAVTDVGLHTFPCRGQMTNDAGWRVDQSLVSGQAQKSHRLLALNHYFTKSREEWRERRSLGKADKLETDPDYYRYEHEFKEHDVNIVRDDRAAMFMQAARAMFYPRSPIRHIGALPSPAHLQTAHGTLLCFDENLLQPTHCSAEQISSSCKPMDAEFEGEDTIRLRFKHPLAPGGVVPIDGTDLFTVVPARGGSALHLRAEGLYLSAQAGSQLLHVDRLEAQSWETFIPLMPRRG